MRVKRTWVGRRGRVRYGRVAGRLWWRYVKLVARGARRPGRASAGWDKRTGSRHLGGALSDRSSGSVVEARSGGGLQRWRWRSVCWGWRERVRWPEGTTVAELALPYGELRLGRCNPADVARGTCSLSTVSCRSGSETRRRSA